MRPKTKKRFTAKILAGYLALGVLGILSGYFIYSEWITYTETERRSLDQEKLIKTNVLLAELYEAENVSKLAQKTSEPEQLALYTKKMDSIINSIDSLRTLTEASTQSLSLDTVQSLLKQKVRNSAELSRLQSKTEKNAPLDSILRAINKMELDMGRITPESLVPNFHKLSSNTQNSIREYARLLNQNIPQEGSNSHDINVDSVLMVSKSMLAQAKNQSSRLEKNLLQTELEMYKTDSELSRKIRAIISALEREIIANAYLENYQKEKALRKSFFLAGTAIFIGLLVAILFTVMVTKDFLKVQQLKESVEKQKIYSETLLRSREQLIHTVSHDIRSPLSTISGYTSMLLKSGDSKRTSSYEKPVREALDYMENLVDDLLDFSQLEQGKLKLQKDTFTITSVVDPILLALREKYADKNLKVQLEIPEMLQNAIVCDRFRFRQIMNNIIGNAFKFTEIGEIQIRVNKKTASDKNWLKIHVADTGIGIPKSKLDTIFKEFTQARNNSEKKYGGYGLGLTISKKLCELLGGYLEVESIEGKGSTFTISLPLQFGKKGNKLPKNSTKSQNKTCSLLVLDDDATLLQLLKALCENQGWDIHTYTAFKNVPKDSSIQYDLVVSDIQMGDFDGFQVPKLLQNQGYAHFQNQPILAMTGQRMFENTLFEQAGFVGTLYKPFTPEAFFQTIQSLIPVASTQLDGIPTSSNHHQKFSLDAIIGFVGEGEALIHVLITFLQDTKKHMKHLAKGIKNGDLEGLKRVAHKMLPMFRQLKVSSCIPILEGFEEGEITHWDLVKEDFARVKEEVSFLKRSLENYLVTHQVD
ncbi:MAG: hybrid sensor histidine kinase/response regulator, partial [Bacteroidota bacterium]